MKAKPDLVRNQDAFTGLCGRAAGRSNNQKTPARRSLCVAVALCSLLGALLAGCQTFPEAYSSAFTHYEAGAPGYATNCLQEGDVVSITFQYSTNLNTLQKIGLDGTLNLESLGPVKAAGKPLVQLQSELAGLYKPQVRDDPLTLKIISAESAVYVEGAVNRPGKIPMERPMTVVESVMEAGGFDAYRANLSEVFVLRVENGRQRIYQLNLKRVFQGRDDTPFYLKPFDVVRVSVKTFNF
jgi:polysaccharide export outer membrane protein